ncbi:MAG TPA: dephospho-CoA kinase [Terriglobales bacterium]|nr:dephospho-CoA kinase [Terriglobales bacterium]
MLRVGLTGGVACGKSTVAEMFARRGVHVARADEIAHQVMQPGQPAYEEVVRRFGRGILQPDGLISRPLLAATVFTPAADGSTRVAELNAIVHPEVIARQDEWMRQVGEREPGAIAMVEAALILEAGVAGRFDKLVVVTCRPEQKVERFARRTGMPLEAARVEVERICAAQLPDSEKIRAADYVIHNCGTPADAEAQAEKVLEQLRGLTRAAPR